MQTRSSPSTRQLILDISILLSCDATTGLPVIIPGWKNYFVAPFKQEITALSVSREAACLHPRHTSQCRRLGELQISKETVRPVKEDRDACVCTDMMHLLGTI